MFNLKQINPLIIKQLLKLEVYFPYIAVLFFFFTVKLHLSSILYTVLIIILGFYFSFVRVLYSISAQNKAFHVFTSCLFSLILILSAVILFCPDNKTIRYSLIISGMICFPVLTFIYGVKQDVRIFLLIFGFSLLAGSRLMI